MKKKIVFWVALVLILVNLFLFTTPASSNQSKLTLKQFEAMADDSVKTPTSPPDDEYPPTRVFPTEGSFSAIDYKS